MGISLNNHYIFSKLKFKNQTEYQIMIVDNDGFGNGYNFRTCGDGNGAILYEGGRSGDGIGSKWNDGNGYGTHDFIPYNHTAPSYNNNLILFLAEKDQ